MKVSTNYYFLISETCSDTENGKYISTSPTIENLEFEMTNIHGGRNGPITKFYG